MATSKRVGVLGAGSFGIAISNLLAHNVDVLLYCRNADLAKSINKERKHLGTKLSDKVSVTSNIEEVVAECTLLFPVVPSDNFRSLIQQISPFLKPYHIIIHGTKGLDLNGLMLDSLDNKSLKRSEVFSMSEVIKQETVVLRVGCLSGPNLASEIMEGQPTATVIASNFDEVIELGKKVLDSRSFRVFGSYDLVGAELAGALKNIIALGSGILRGFGLGKNIQAMLITRGLLEMVHFGKALGSTSEAFLGIAGIGDLIATATSINSRNFSFGYRIGQGETLEQIKSSMPELAEGLRTVKIATYLAKANKMHVPITQTIYRVIYEGMEVERAIEFLMRYPYSVDVDFLN